MNTSRNSDRRMDEAQIAELLQKVGARPQPSDAAVRQAREKVHAAWQSEVNARRRQRRSFGGWATAAGVFLAVGLGLFLAQNPAPDTSSGHLAHHVNEIAYQPSGTGEWLPVDGVAQFAAGDRLRSGADSYAMVELADGITVRMDAASELELGAGQELYLEEGAVYVDAPGASTVVVETPLGSARDIGTRFEVRMFDDAWRVQVREGIVLMDDHQQGAARAVAGERLLASGDELQRQAIGTTDVSWQWTHQAASPMTIEGSTLGSYLAWWGRESGVEVGYSKPIDAAIADQTRLHGDLDGLSMEQGFRAVVAGAGFRVVDRSEQQVILAR